MAHKSLCLNHILILLFSFYFIELDDLPLSASKTEMATIVKVMQLPDSGLEIRDRMWLKITITNAVIGELWNYMWMEFTFINFFFLRKNH